jgi:hypothetical protein
MKGARMDTQHHHTMKDLFAQLGLPDDEQDILQFVGDHRPLPDHRLLYDAPFWNDAQAAFLRENLKDDSDWAIVIEELNTRLREHTTPSELPAAGNKLSQVDPGPLLQGEGNYTAARHYDEKAEAYARTQDVEAAGRAAAPANADEAAEMQEAEEIGKSKARR